MQTLFQNDMTPLLTAARAGNAEVVESLLNNHATVDKADDVRMFMHAASPNSILTIISNDRMAIPHW